MKAEIGRRLGFLNRQMFGYTHTGIEAITGRAPVVVIEIYGVLNRLVRCNALIDANAEGLTKLPVSGFPLLTHWHMIHRRQKQLSAVADSFRQFVMEEAEQHLPMDRIHERVRQAVK
ncbi:hypothetical protein A3709_04605 [Halioglobus sp. HI00S01]|uniref:hypothetical protein n=1 Tax=Halioglobus sp. HI00S01 TaxID=1822214 RepID=UPI0007C24DC3|nr:hypothetical protein [Halioglobus sp. HI00S01]KZX57054.1 hypothetical protein A3709_04605 [Halioglobus sp. HI00S01]